MHCSGCMTHKSLNRIYASVITQILLNIKQKQELNRNLKSLRKSLKATSEGKNWTSEKDFFIFCFLEYFFSNSLFCLLFKKYCFIILAQMWSDRNARQHRDMQSLRVILKILSTNGENLLKHLSLGIGIGGWKVPKETETFHYYNLLRD